MIFTLTDDKMTGTFGSATETGTMTITSKGETFDYTIVETLGGIGTFTYDFNSLSDSGEASKVPPTPCIIGGCTPGETVPNGPVSFSLPYGVHQPIPYGDGLTETQFEDGVYDYSGYGTQTEKIISSVPEPAAWTLMLVGFGLLGAATRVRRARRPGSWVQAIEVN
jgi:hypothetical protein